MASETMASATNITSADFIGRPSTFLPLAPTTSASYPQQRRSEPTAAADTDADTAATATTTVAVVAAATEATSLTASPATMPAAAADMEAEHHRRRSSLASNESGNSAKLRFLRLGPVHWGEDVDGKGDWSEEVAVNLTE